MLRNGAREKALSRKVLLSLLMAGTMSVCISGGDVWAAEGKLTGDVTYNQISEVPASVEMNGHNITSNVILNAENKGLSIIGTGKETLTLNGSENVQFGIAAEHNENAKVVISNLKTVNIIGDYKEYSSIHTSNKGSIAFDGIGSFYIKTEKTMGVHTQGGDFSVKADTINIETGDNAVFAQLSGGQSDSSSVTLKAIGDMNLHSATSIAVSAANLTNQSAPEQVKVDLQGRNITIASDKDWGVASTSMNYENSSQLMLGKTAVIVQADKNVNIVGVGAGILAANGVAKGDALVEVAAGDLINITATENKDGQAYALYSGYNGLIKVNEKGTAEVKLTGDVIAENGGEILLGGTDKHTTINGNVTSRGSSIKVKGKVAINGKLEVIAKTYGDSSFESSGESLNIVYKQTGNSAEAIHAESYNSEHNTVLDFNAKNTSLEAFSENNMASGISITNGSQTGYDCGQSVTFAGNKLAMNVNSVNDKAHGVHIEQSSFGGKFTTQMNFNSSVTEITVKGTAKFPGFDQVAGIWDSPGFCTADMKTNVIFTGSAVLDVTSTNVNTYGIYIAGDKGSSTVDFKGNTTLKAHNGEDLGIAVYASGANRVVNINKDNNKGIITKIEGDLVAENGGEINLALNTHDSSFKGAIAANAGTINLGGSEGTYDFTKLTTQNTGKITVVGGTLELDDLSNTEKYKLVEDSLVISGGNVKAASEDIFTSGLTEAGTVTDSGIVLEKVNQVVDFNSGKLILSDEKYNLAWLKTAKEALNNADKGKMGLVVTGTLVTTDGKIQTEASAGDLADTGAIHAGVTGKVDTNDVTIGSGGLENLGVKDLALGGSAADASKVTVGYGKELTLVGSGSENDALVKTSDGTAKNNVAVAVGGSGNAGTLNLGVAGTNSGGNLNATVAITNDNSKVNVDAGTFKVNKISADKGAINVNEGAALKTDNLTVGSEGSTVKLSGTGTLEAQNMTVSKGTVEVTGTAKAGNLTVNDNNAKISVGSGDSAGSLVASNASLNGAAVVLDPVWKGNDKIEQASKAALTFTNNSVDGLLTVGRNSVLILGTDDTGKAEQTFAESELTWGQNGVSAALYIDKAQQLDASKGGLYIDGTKTAAAASANEATFAAGSLLIVNGSGIGTSGTAALTGGSGSTLTVSQGAKLYLTSTNAGTYTVTKGFTSNTIDGWFWSADAASADVSVNKLSEIEKVEQNTANGDFTVTVKQADIKKAYAGIALPNILQAMDQSQTGYAGIKYLTELANDKSLSPSGFIAAVNGFAQGAENSGASHSGTMAAFTIGDTVQGRMSLVNDAAAPQGGNGRRADTGDNGSIWAQYIHNKDKVDNLGGASYDGQYNGVIIGSDFAPTGKYHSGVAFSYGDGSSSGSVSKNEFDFWGLSYYGSIKNDDTNVTFDAGYSRTSNSVKGAVAIESNTKVLTLGVKGEKLINNGHGTSYVPYAGLRYLNVDGGSYNGTIDGKVAAHYSADTANIWMLPLGIGVRNETITASGWKVRPMADIAYVWILGDKNSTMDVTVPGVNAADRLGYDIMDSGFFVGKLGIEAEKGDWTYGLGYAYQKGSHAQNSKFMLNVTYSF